MEFTVPDSVQFILEIPRKSNPRLVGDKPPMYFELCFTHAVKAVVKGHTVTTRLGEYPGCDKCHPTRYSRDDERDEFIASL